MALRTFRHNPSLGGFGGESGLSSGATTDTVGADAFCQIIKELVDNAVDACRVSVNNKATTKSTAAAAANNKKKKAATGGINAATDTSRAAIVHRVRINLDPSTEEDGTEVLRVTVTDTGCGMKDIQTCVDAFQTSKVHNAENNTNKNDKEGNRQDKNTSGRYGIGLTLCLLHAQRLVPNTRASIKSATAEQDRWTVMSCVVDTEADSVRCFPDASLAKAVKGESGTSICLLVPGGTTAVLAWPRLAEYFARFQLSLGLHCRVEVLAPSLSSVPLQVRPIAGSVSLHAEETNSIAAADKTPKKQPAWSDLLLRDETNDDEKVKAVTPDDARFRRVGKQDKGPSTDRLLCAAQRFLERHVLPTNLAHSRVPIRLPGTNAADLPSLEVTLIVHSSSEEDGNGNPSEQEDAASVSNSAEASMVLIRMVNQIPLLDSAEGVACGLVQGVVAKESLWQSVGLDVSLRAASASMARSPVYSVKDSSQVMPYLKSQRGGLFDDNADEEDSSEESDDESIGEAILEGKKRPRRGSQKRPHKVFLPADARLGNILLIVQINAEPSQLPLPTLCKGRIPQDNLAINQALETALKGCLRKLQTSNPSLFLTSRELRNVERKVCFAPLLSNAVASILSRSQSEAAREAINTVVGWNEHLSPACSDADDDHESSNGTAGDHLNIDRMGHLVHDRLKFLLEQPKKVPQREQVSDDELEGDDCSQGSDGVHNPLFSPALLNWARHQAEKESMREDKESSDEDEGSYEDLM
eukprot:scaffold374_cov160-Amphora_coffeaeformis.AAC.10